VRSLQIRELSFISQQEKNQGEIISQKVLFKMPKAHFAQGSEIARKAQVIKYFV
jgi:hypothetical protein